MTRTLLFAVFAFLCAVSAEAAPTAVFMGPLRVGSGATPEVARQFEQKILASARRHTAAFTIVSSADVRGMVDVEVARTASGCDGEASCVTELASALDAPEIITGEVGRLGSTWVLSLTRSERTTLRVHVRVSREARGAIDSLLPLIDGAVDELLQVESASPSAAAASPLPVVGGVVTGVGLLGLGVGGVLAFVANGVYADAETALASTNDAAETARLRADAIQRGEALNTAAVVAWIAGGALTLGGVALLAVSLVGGE